MMYVADKNGGVLDSVPIFDDNGDWSPDGTRYCYRSSSNGMPILAVWKFGTGNVGEYVIPQQGLGPHCVRWIGNDRLAWNDRGGIHTLSIHSPTTVHTLRQSCESRYWQWFDVSEDGSALICARIDKKLLNESTLIARSRIYKVRIADGVILWPN
jgi:hypothetical protein